MNIRFKLVIMLAMVAMVAVSSFALPNCDYYMPAPGGTDCNVLPSPPPDGATYEGICAYFWCDHNIGCGSNQYQQKIRTRNVWKFLGPPTIYYTKGDPWDNDYECCYCNTSYHH